MNTSTTQIPRVEIPNLTEAEKQQVADFRAEAAWKLRTQQGFLRALFAKNPTPFTGVRKTPAKPTKHQKAIANARTRSAYLREMADA